MSNSKTIRLLLLILLTAAFAAASSAQTQSPVDKSESPSPVRTNALALVSELEKPVTCPEDGAETICLAQHYQAKTNAAIAGLKSIVRVDEQREGVIADMQKRIDVRGGIIQDLSRVDTNSQTIDGLGQNSKQLYEQQHRDDKDTIGDLQESLQACRNNQKWIFLGGAATGGVIAWKLKGSGSRVDQLLTNGLQFTGSAPLQMFQLSAEQKARAALNGVIKK